MKQKAFWAVVLAASIAGSAGVFIKHIHLSASAIAWMRSAIPALLTAAWMFYKGIPFFRGSYKKMLSASVLNALRMYLFFVAFLYTSIGNAVILFYSWPIFAALFSLILLKERLKKRQFVLLFLAFLGLIIAYSNKEFSFEDKDFVGMIAALLSAGIYAMTVVIFKTETNNFTRNELVFYQNFVGGLVFLPFFVLAYEAFTFNGVALGIIYSALIGMLVFNLFFYGLKHLTATTASALMYIEVVSALIFSYFWMGDFLNTNMIVGGAIILWSSFLLTRDKQKAKVG